MRKVLVVDDETNMRFMMRMILETEGYEVTEAHHGGVALERVKEERPDLVVVDLVMPVMSGHELIDHLRADEETADIPIIVVSAGPTEAVTGVDAVLRKPFELDTLVDAARSVGRKDSI